MIEEPIRVYEENGVLVKVYAPRWADGATGEFAWLNGMPDDAPGGDDLPAKSG